MNCLLEKTTDGMKWKCARKACGYEMSVKPQHKKPPKRGRCCESPVKQRREGCQHLGQFTGFVECQTCQGNVRLRVLQCDLHGKCTIGKRLDGIACCATCNDYLPVRIDADERGNAAGW